MITAVTQLRDDILRFAVDKEDHSYLQQKLASKDDELSSMISSSCQEESMSVRSVWRKSFFSHLETTPVVCYDTK